MKNNVVLEFLVSLLLSRIREKEGEQLHPIASTKHVEMNAFINYWKK